MKVIKKVKAREMEMVRLFILLIKSRRELNLSFHLCLKLFLRQQKPELSAGDHLEKLLPFPSGYNC